MIMQTDLQRELEQLGFSERQACVYLALLRFGKSGAQQLALATGLPRASCYDTLQQLVSQGLIKSDSEDGQKLFVTEPPDRIKTLIDLQLAEIQTRQRRALQFLPQLSALAGDATVKPRFRIINDNTELHAIHKDYADMHEPILQLVGYDAFLELHRRRVVQENVNRLRQTQSQGRAVLVTDMHVELPPGTGFKVRCVPRAMLEVRGEMTVCADHVLLFAYTQMVVAIEIISPAIADTCRAALELAWQQAGEIEKKLGVEHD